MNDAVALDYPLTAKASPSPRIAALPGANQDRPIVVVLGMHRSGTSVCAHFLSAMGIDMADVTAVDASKTQERWERSKIVAFHDRILSLFNRDYLGPFHDFAFPVAWWADPRVVEIRRELAGFLKERMKESVFGFQDPRTVRLMPVWHQIFRELKLVPKIVFCLRNPAQVARSLRARDGIDLEIGEYRWLTYMTDFYRYCGSFDFCTIEYEAWFVNDLTNAEKLRNFLHLQWVQSEFDFRLTLCGIIDRSLNHDDPQFHQARQPLVRSLYKLVRRAGIDARAREQVGYLVRQFVSFQQLQRPFQRAFEQVNEICGKYPTLARAAAASTMQAEIETLRQVAGEAAREMQERGAAAEAVQHLIATLHDRLAQAEREANERAAALDARQSEIAMLRDRLMQADRAADERAAALDAMRSKIGILHDALAQADREADERGEALRQSQWEMQERLAASAAMQDEIAALRRAKAQAEERAAAAQVMRDEIAALQSAVLQSRREAQERIAAANSMDAEIVSLRNALAVARQVGKAALRALGSRVPTTDGERLGWRQAVAQFFRLRTNF